jgi:hypothetical protein
MFNPGSLSGDGSDLSKDTTLRILREVCGAANLNPYIVNLFDYASPSPQDLFDNWSKRDASKLVFDKLPISIFNSYILAYGDYENLGQRDSEIKARQVLVRNYLKSLNEIVLPKNNSGTPKHPINWQRQKIKTEISELLNASLSKSKHKQKVESCSVNRSVTRIMNEIIQSQIEVIKSNNLYNWFDDYPWLTGYLGDINSPIWFLGENPSLSQVNKQSKKSTFNENLQWNASAGDQLLREALTEAGLKKGDVSKNSGWACYITNVIKEPEIVNERNRKKSDSSYWKKQAEMWLPVLQNQLDIGSPKLIVTFGGQADKIFRHMVKLGLKSPKQIKIHHYSYIMLRPEASTKRGPRHPDRISEFKLSIQQLANNEV